MKNLSEVNTMPLAQFFDYTLDYEYVGAFMNPSGDHAAIMPTTT